MTDMMHGPVLMVVIAVLLVLVAGGAYVTFRLVGGRVEAAEHSEPRRQYPYSKD